MSGMRIPDEIAAAMAERLGLFKTASAYSEFKEALSAVPAGDCRAVQGVYKRFMNQLEAEDAFMRARRDCEAKCPSFRPQI